MFVSGGVFVHGGVFVRGGVCQYVITNCLHLNTSLAFLGQIPITFSVLYKSH